MDHSTFVPSLIWVLPFVTLLAGIALLPLVLPHWWEPHRYKLLVSGLLSLPVLALYARHSPHAIAVTAEDYVSFMVLLASLFIISGGVFLEGDLEATPAVNTKLLAAGSLLASLIGTTGASMLLIRPLLQSNSERRHVTHTVVFFIFLVSNIGGCLTPLGDPPLFLGYLQGVPFAWTLRLGPAWLFTSSLLLVVYYLWDRRAYAREAPQQLQADRTRVQPLRVMGRRNLVWLAGIVAAAAWLSSPWREAAMVALSLISLKSTPRAIRDANRFSLSPIIEVAVVFAGIFATMIPALDILRARGSELGITEPWQFFWATGGLSSFLDNAPTYLTFLALGQGLGLDADVVGLPHEHLIAISLGAVFMGANTYIGNGPNFMVRSIAESRGVRMPHFGGYMLYSGAVLIPTFLIVTVVFFRG